MSELKKYKFYYSREEELQGMVAQISLMWAFNTSKLFFLHVERLFFQVQGTNAQQLNTIEISNIFPSFAMPIAK